jgi:ADP-ribose pyrophosphatase
MIQPWRLLESRPLGDFRVFRIRGDRKVSPRTGQPHEFFVLESVSWVNVVAVTSDNQLVMVEQLRHGTNTVELEIPGGLTDPDDVTPALTGVRELREETGYEGENARVLGEIYPNPAIMNNICYTVLVQNCQLKHGIALDQGEDLITRLVPVPDIPELIASGKIRHSLVVAGLYHFELWRRGKK